MIFVKVVRKQKKLFFSNSTTRQTENMPKKSNKQCWESSIWIYREKITRYFQSESQAFKFQEPFWEEGRTWYKRHREQSRIAIDAVRSVPVSPTRKIMTAKDAIDECTKILDKYRVKGNGESESESDE